MCLPIPCFLDEVHVVSYLVLSITGNCLQPQLRVEGGFSVALDDRWQGCTARGGCHAPASPEGACFGSLGTLLCNQEELQSPGTQGFCVTCFGGCGEERTLLLDPLWDLVDVTRCHPVRQLLALFECLTWPTLPCLLRAVPLTSECFIEASFEKGLGQWYCRF